MDLTNVKQLKTHLKVNGKSCRISCSHNHETLAFGICESWSNYEKKTFLSLELTEIYLDNKNTTVKIYN